MRLPVIAAFTAGLLLFSGGAALAQSGASSPLARPWGRVSFFVNSWQTTTADGTKQTLTQMTTAVSYQLPDEDATRVDYGLDARYSTFLSQSRASRTSLYEGFIGARLAGGAIRVRAGHFWLTDLGSLGAVAGGAFEYAQPRASQEDGRFRVGAFTGREPNVLDVGYAANVEKSGGYVTYESGVGNARRHTVGYVQVQNASLTERAVVTAMNFVPIGSRVFLYQTSEYDVRAPAGQAASGLAYFFTMGRVRASDRVDLQGTYNRGRSIDTRGLSEDILAGRPVAQSVVDGLSYESVGGRVTVEVLKRVRVYGGYSRDKNSRDADPTGRTLVGGYAPNVANSGFDLTASDSLMDRSSGGSYHSRYVSLGRQLGRKLYLMGDYTTSLSVIRFSRSDGFVVETRPQTTRVSGMATWNVSRAFSWFATLERSTGDDYKDFRVLTGLNYRIR